MGYKGIDAETYLTTCEAAAAAKLTKDEKAFVDIHLNAARLGLRSNDKSMPDYTVKTEHLQRLEQLAKQEANDEKTVVSEGDIDQQVLADAVEGEDNQADQTDQEGEDEDQATDPAADAEPDPEPKPKRRRKKKSDAK